MLNINRSKATILILCILPFPAYADFGLQMYIGDLNHSGAGKTALTDNATTVFNNPAGMSYLSKQHWSIDSQYYMSSAHFTDTGSTDAIGAPMTGDNGGDPGMNTFVPGLYYSYQFNEQWTLGAAINAPFGLKTEWDTDTWVGRYQSVSIGIETINYNPTVSYRINDTWSVGGGVSVQRAEANFKNAIDFGAVCFSLLMNPTTCAGLGIPAPQSADGTIDLDGHDWGVGFNLGLMYRSRDTTIGVTYRSAIDYTLEGTADFTVPASAAAFATLVDPAFTDTTASVDLTLPEVVAIGLSHQFNPDWAMMVDLTWTRWSRINEYRIQFSNPAQPDLVIPRNWEDTLRIALGADYRVNGKWRIQGGVAYAPSAIPDEYYDPTIPTTDAYWINLGTNYQASSSFNMSIGLAHIIFQDSRTIDYTGSYGDTVRGTMHPDLNVIGATLNWSM